MHVSSPWVGLSQRKRGGAVKRVVCREIGGGGGGEGEGSNQKILTGRGKTIFWNKSPKPDQGIRHAWYIMCRAGKNKGGGGVMW